MQIRLVIEGILSLELSHLLLFRLGREPEFMFLQRVSAQARLSGRQLLTYPPL